MKYIFLTLILLIGTQPCFAQDDLYLLIEESGSEYSKYEGHLTRSGLDMPFDKKTRTRKEFFTKKECLEHILSMRVDHLGEKISDNIVKHSTGMMVWFCLPYSALKDILTKRVHKYYGYPGGTLERLENSFNGSHFHKKFKDILPQNIDINNLDRNKIFPLDKNFLTSFDCSKATKDVEKMICEDGALAKLDRELNQAYQAKLKDTTTKDALKSDQRNWLKKTQLCKTKECISKAYQKRNKEIKPTAIPQKKKSFWNWLF